MNQILNCTWKLPCLCQRKFNGQVVKLLFDVYNGQRIPKQKQTNKKDERKTIKIYTNLYPYVFLAIYIKLYILCIYLYVCVRIYICVNSFINVNLWQCFVLFLHEFLNTEINTECDFCKSENWILSGEYIYPLY